jgi:hypothetical protein
MNDERPIEKLLRRAAQKRTDEAGAPPELHPANRRLLQAEVTRQFPPATAPQREASPPFWVALTRRWAYALALIPVIGILAFVLLPSLSKSKSKASMELAQSAPVETMGVPSVMTDAALAPQPATAAREESDRLAYDSLAPGRSGGGNLLATRSFESEPQPAATVTGAKFSGASREDTALRVITDSSATDTSSYGFNLAGAATARRQEAATGRLAKGTETEFFYRSAPATVLAPEASPATKVVSSSETKAKTADLALQSTSAPARELGVKTEASRVTNFYAAAPKELKTATPAPAGVMNNLGAIAATEIAKDGYSDDKAWLARGGGGGGAGADRQQRSTLNSQAFSNLSAEQMVEKKFDNRARKLTPPVLVNFKVEQAGRDLRVVDGDGSVYNGVVNEENTLYKQMIERHEQKLATANNSRFNFQTPKLAEAIAPAKQQQQQDGDYYLYRVEGTNRTLNQNVVFTWNFVDTNALANGNLNYQNVQQKLDATKLPAQFPALLQNSFINGRAQFGEGREVEVNAVPVKP